MTRVQGAIRPIASDNRGGASDRGDNGETVIGRRRHNRIQRRLGCTQTRQIRTLAHLRRRALGRLAVVAPGHPLAQRRQVSLSQVPAYPLALPDAASTLRRLLEISGSRQVLTLEPVMTSNHL